MKATKAIVRQRTEEILGLRLDGASGLDVLQYVAEKQQEGAPPWTVPEGARPIAERTVWWYIHKADQLLAEHFRNERGRQRRLRLHLARRENLYAKSVLAGDYRAALSCLQDLADLQGLYPPKRAELTGKAGAPVVLSIVEEVVTSRQGAAAPHPLVANVIEEVVTRGNGTLPGPTPPGTAGLP
jgi:hypothetical protein